jgi:hypothetical protein
MRAPRRTIADGPVGVPAGFNDAYAIASNDLSHCDDRRIGISRQAGADSRRNGVMLNPHPHLSILQITDGKSLQFEI